VTITHSLTLTHGTQEHSTDDLHVTITHSLTHSWHTGTLNRPPACDNYTLTHSHTHGTQEHSADDLHVTITHPYTH